MVSHRAHLLLLLTAWLNPLSCLAHGAASSHTGAGLVGYGIKMWEPSCAYACKRLLSLSPLECSVETHEKAKSLRKRHGGHNNGFSTSSHCYNTDHAFLLSLAWCLHQQCSEIRGVESWRLERFWVTDAVPESHDAPNYTYAHALDLCDGGLKPVLSQGQHLKEPSSLSPDDYEAVQTWMEDYARVEHQHARYGLFLLLCMILLPLVLSLGHFLIAAISPTWERVILSHVVEPALWGRRHLVSLPYDIGMVPLRGQALLIAFIVFLNLGLSTVHYGGSTASFKYDTESGAFWTYWSNRVAYLSFANLVAVFLYSGRNNPLITLSGWNYGTFILLHRWVAYICVAQGSAHSLVKFIRHIPVFSEVFAKLYWNIGFGAFITFVALFATSILPVRRRWYQAFLDIHNVLAVVALILCFFHVYVKFAYSWGFENWVVLAAMIWAGERLVRLIKLAAHGVQTATITPLDEEYFEVSIEGVSQTGYTYLYFPQGWWRLWEGHPFSVAAAVNPLAVGAHNYAAPKDVPETMFELGSDHDDDADSTKSDDNEVEDTDAMLWHDPQDIRLTTLSVDGQGPSLNSPTTPMNYVENVGPYSKEDVEDDEDDNPLISSGHQAGPSLSFLLRRQKGLTNKLFHSSQPRKVLIEGPYSSISTHSSLSMATAQVVCIVGGSGIAAVLPLLRARSSGTVGRTVLHWGCRSEALVKASGVRDLGPSIESNILVGRRLDVEHIVRQEAQSCHGEVAIVTCGPVGMADDVRYAVVMANRSIKGKGSLRLYEECYSW